MKLSDLLFCAGDGQVRCWCGTIAACAFAAVLLAIVQSGGISSLVTQVIRAALSVSL